MKKYTIRLFLVFISISLIITQLNLSVVSAQIDDANTVNITSKEDAVEKTIQLLSELHPGYTRQQISDAVIQSFETGQVHLPETSGFRNWQGITTGQLAFAINLTISLVTGGVLSNLASKLTSSTLRAVRNSITAELARFGASSWGAAFIETALYVTDPGTFIATQIDSIDPYPNNGRINLWK